MTLEKAYKIGTKYGFTFNGIGPSLSMVDDKVGVCVNILDNNFGYIRRNFVFEDINDYEEFLKKYSYYLHNKDKEQLFIVLDDYEKSNPNIIYSNELDEEKKKIVDYKNKEIILSDIKSFLKNFIMSLNQIRALLSEKVLVEQDYYNKLKYYQELLYKAYNMEYTDEAMVASKDLIDQFNNEVKEFDLSHKRELSSIDLENESLFDINNLYDRVFNECRRFIKDDRWVKCYIDEIKFKNSTSTLNKMIDYLINNPKADESTEKELENIKNNDANSIEEETIKKDYFSRYTAIYDDVDKNYNQVIFNAEDLKIEEFNRKEENKQNKIIDLKSIFDSLDDEHKKAIRLIHSPLKPIILYVIEQAYFKNKGFNFDKDEFRHIYELMGKCFKNSENLVFKLKYFKNLELDTYEVFIKSIVKIAKSICNSYTKLPYDLKLYSLNYDSCMISASDSNIKNGSDVINVINAKKGCSYIYSPIKIVYSKDDYLFSIIPNDNVIYFPRYLNTSKKENNTIILNLFDEGYGIEKLKDINLLIITKFDLNRSVKYKYSTMIGKEK